MPFFMFHRVEALKVEIQLFFFFYLSGINGILAPTYRDNEKKREI